LIQIQREIGAALILWQNRVKTHTRGIYRTGGPAPATRPWTHPLARPAVRRGQVPAVAGPAGSTATSSKPKSRSRSSRP
jgi:hypothetical protein